MSTTVTLAQPRAPKRSSWPATLAAGLVSFAIAAFLGMGQSGGRIDLGLVFGLVAAGLTVYILRSGRVHTPRIVLFVVEALLFTIVFEIGHELNRGSILLGEQQISSGTTPICPITVGFVVPPYLLRGEMIFPASVAALESVVFLWLGFALLFGRGWCGWLCFFGGVDQFFAAVGQKVWGSRPPVRIAERVAKYGRLFPYALLLFLIVVAVVALEPFFCAWLCPLRLAYDPPMVTTSVQWLSAIVFVTLGMSLLVVGPFLTAKRLFCSYACPLLPVNALLGFASPFRVRVDRSLCTDCGRCTRACPHTAITPETVTRGGTTPECTRCGKCLDECPKGALEYRLLGASVPARPAFVALAVAFGVMFLAGYLMALLVYLQTGVMPEIGV